jgi:hypothetical protein
MSLFQKYSSFEKSLNSWEQTCKTLNYPDDAPIMTYSSERNFGQKKRLRNAINAFFGEGKSVSLQRNMCELSFPLLSDSIDVLFRGDS